MKLDNYIITTIILSLPFISCDRNKSNRAAKTFWSDSTHLSVEEKMQRQVWTDFRQAVIYKNITAFERLSLPIIQCPDCYSYLPKIKSDTSLTDDCVNIETFVSNGGFESIFNNKANDFYFNYDNIGSISASDNTDVNQENCFKTSKADKQKILQISINDKNCSDEECSQTIFSFTKTDKGYKFCSMMHIP